jgi:Polyketide cyclase / dehydrase and lipid transport
MAQTRSKLQGRDAVVVNASADLLWLLISDSNELTNWGPPVRQVEVFTRDGKPEGLGTARKVQAEFGRRSGFFLEHRVEHVPGRGVAYVIDEDNFGLARFLSKPGFSLELEPHDGGGTSVVFSFFHDPRGVGRVLNPLIRWQQRRNRLEALKSLKLYAEEMARSQPEGM